MLIFWGSWSELSGRMTLEHSPWEAMPRPTTAYLLIFNASVVPESSISTLLYIDGRPQYQLRRGTFPMAPWSI